MLTPMNGAARGGKPQEPESWREGLMQVPAPRTCTSVDTIDEQQAWASSLAGDGVAFGLIFDLHHQRVFRHVLRLTCDVHDSEDVVAAAFLELWRRRKDVPVVDGSVLPWLLVVANNLCLNRGRAMRRHRAFISRLPRQEEQSAPADTVALSRADLDLDPALVSAVRRLGPADQQLLALIALEGFPISAAAQTLGLTDAAARSRWQRIRLRLAQTPAATTPSASQPLRSTR